MVITQKLEKQDIPKLLELYKQLVDDKNDIDVAISQYEKIQSDDNYLLIVAKEDDNLVGTALGVCCYDLAIQGKPFMVIESVVVDENSRGKGIGRMIFSELERFALKRNCSYSIIVSSAYRKGAHKFYQSLGFEDDVRGFRKNYL